MRPADRRLPHSRAGSGDRAVRCPGACPLRPLDQEQIGLGHGVPSRARRPPPGTEPIAVDVIHRAAAGLIVVHQAEVGRSPSPGTSPGGHARAPASSSPAPRVPPARPHCPAAVTAPGRHQAERRPASVSGWVMPLSPRAARPAAVVSRPAHRGRAQVVQLIAQHRGQLELEIGRRFAHLPSRARR